MTAAQVSGHHNIRRRTGRLVEYLCHTIRIEPKRVFNEKCSHEVKVLLKTVLKFISLDNVTAMEVKVVSETVKNGLSKKKKKVVHKINLFSLK